MKVIRTTPKKETWNQIVNTLEDLEDWDYTESEGPGTRRFDLGSGDDGVSLWIYGKNDEVTHAAGWASDKIKRYFALQNIPFQSL